MVQLLRDHRGEMTTGQPAGGWRARNIAAGNYFFRHRNALFPALFALTALLARPRPIGTPALDAVLASAGVAVALAGQAIRLLTIGYEYIERGGKEGKVYASHLVHGGVYALTRNPMYLGNGLIAIGISMVAGAPLIYLIVLPLFLYIYQAIITAEETYLRRQFGAEYERYCAEVNRLLPALEKARAALAPLSYNWRQAVRKDLSTMAGLFLGLILLPVLRRLWLEGWGAARADLPRTIAAVLVVLGLYGVAITLKRQRKVFYARGG